MEMIWQLFGTHITLFLIILFLLITWFVAPRKYKKFRLYTIIGCCVILIGSITSATITYWPKTYDKHYLSEEVPSEVINTPLKSLADSINFWIGMTINPVYSDYDFYHRSLIH